MIVNEVIAKLAQMPPNIEVRIINEPDGNGEITVIAHDKEQNLVWIYSE